MSYCTCDDFFCKHLLHWLFGNLDVLSKNEEDEFMLMKFKSTNYGKIGELIFSKYLQLKNIDYKCQSVCGSHVVDFETATSFYEIKTRSYNVSGTAGEKIISVPHKYRHIPKIYGKPIDIILIGNQELDDRGVFDTDVENSKFIELIKEFGFKYVKFSTLLPRPDNLINIKYIYSPIKWVGGKKSIMNVLLPNIYDNLTKKFYDVCSGGLSVTLNLMKRIYITNQSSHNIYVNDINKELINVYQVIKDKPELLIDFLSKCIISQSEFDRIKIEYNNHLTTDIKLDDVILATYFIYLNKTSHGGIYRLNRSGLYNVPFNKNDFNAGKLNNIYSADNIINLSKLFRYFDVKFSTIDIFNIEYDTESLYYIDPPYFSDTKKSIYTATEFNNEKFVNFIGSSNSKLIISNSIEFLDRYSDTNFDKVLYLSAPDLLAKTSKKNRNEVILFKGV